MTSINDFVLSMSARLGVRYTEEQTSFVKDITSPCCVFASPGTGKTQAAVGALATAELFHKISGKNIYALSFTNAATAELAVRHKRACEALGITQTVNFSTVHKMCTNILKKYYNLINMGSLKIGDAFKPEVMHKIILSTAEEIGVPITDDKVKDLLRAVKTLNSALVFDREQVEKESSFISLDMTYEEFTKIRKMLYDLNKQCGAVPVSDIMIYTLELLVKNPDVVKECKDNVKVLLIDESQDMSLLQLSLVHYMCDNTVIIGDIKQQIYQFNGACPEIVERYKQYYPNARTIEFTQSFRCKNEIAKYATNIVIPNELGGEDFTGVGEGGLVQKLSKFDAIEFVEDLSVEYTTNNKILSKDILFLYRNNISSIPICEALFKERIPFRVDKYPGVHNIPIMFELCKILDFCVNPDMPGADYALRFLIPEFGNCKVTPIKEIAEELNVSIFEVNYDFKDKYWGNEAMARLLDIHDSMKTGEQMSVQIEKIYDIFYSKYAKERERYLDNDAEYYMALASSAISGKTYSKFKSDEKAKLDFIEENNQHRRGLRCYTMHSAKGLEADEVYILDANDGVIPNARVLRNLAKRGLTEQIAQEIRNERNLVYVACTRAKDSLFIVHNNEVGISKLFSENDPYIAMQKMYKQSGLRYQNEEEFIKFSAEEGYE